MTRESRTIAVYDFADARLLVAQHDVLAEDDVAAAAAEEQRVQRLADRQPDRARPRLREHDDQLVAQQRAEARPADDERRVFRAARRAGREQLILRALDAQRVGEADVVRASHAAGTTRVYAGFPRAGRRAGRSRSRSARG